jgi:hypothetical protein
MNLEDSSAIHPCPYPFPFPFPFPFPTMLALGIGIAIAIGDRCWMLVARRWILGLRVLLAS